MRTVIYARVSTKDQSCDLQLRDLRAYCAARGFSVQHEYVDVESGAKDLRPQVNELMAVARKRLFDGVDIAKSQDPDALPGAALHMIRAAYRNQYVIPVENGS